MIFTLIIVLGVGLVHAELRWYDIPRFYLEKPSVSTLEAALNDLLTDDIISTTRVPRSLILNSFLQGGSADSSLDVNHKAAISIYTTVSIVPNRVNTALRSLNETALRVWSQYLKMFHLAIEKLPPISARLCRGVPLLLYDSKNKSLVGSTVPLVSLSFSTDRLVCESFAKQQSNISCNIIWLNSSSARSIRNYSIVKNTEYILLPGTLAKILSITPQESSKCSLVEMQELAPNDPAYRPPYPVNVVNIGTLTDIEGKKIDDFLRGYNAHSVRFEVSKLELESIRVTGGLGTSYSPWPYIHKVEYVVGGAPSILQDNFLIGVNNNSMRGMFLSEVIVFLQDIQPNPGQNIYLDVTPRVF